MTILQVQQHSTSSRSKASAPASSASAAPSDPDCSGDFVWANNTSDYISKEIEDNSIGCDYKSGHFTNKRGLQIFTRAFTPTAVQPKTAAVVVHGLYTQMMYGFGGEQYNYQGSMIEKYVSNGTTVFGFDMQSMGRSEGIGGPSLRGHFVSIKELGEDLTRLLALVRKEIGQETELMVHGSCFGSTVIMKALLDGLQHDRFIRLKGAVLQSPCVVNIFDEAQQKAIAAYSQSEAQLPLPLDVYNLVGADFTDVAGNSEGNRFTRMPLKVRVNMRVGVAQELIATHEQFSSKGHGMAQLTLPFLALHADEDPWAFSSGSKQLFKVSATKPEDKRMILFAAPMKHDLLVEEGNAGVKEVVCSWVRHVGAGGLGNGQVLARGAGATATGGLAPLAWAAGPVDEVVVAADLPVGA
jgi:alpha-beta hydrolase superfamily lysophospholipase